MNLIAKCFHCLSTLSSNEPKIILEKGYIKHVVQKDFKFVEIISCFVLLISKNDKI